MSSHPWPSSVLHLDVDSFFAAVEQRDNPRLRGLPVAVGSGVVASCSHEAKRQGVTTGMALGEARARCRALVLVPGDYRRYEQAARRILAICHDLTPIVEVAALDDLYLDLTRCGTDSTGLRTAAELRSQIRAEVGLGVSLGLGSSKLLARTATRQAKRRPGRGTAQDEAGAIVRVPPGDERIFLAPWPIEVLPGAGGRIRARLERLNVRQVGALADMPLSVLCGLFGERGRVLRAQAQGIDLRAVEATRPPQSVSRRTSFDPPSGDPAFLRAMLDHLLERAASWLRFQGLETRGLRLTLRYGDYEFAEGRQPLPQQTADETVLRAAAAERFGKLYCRRLPLRLLGVELAPLAPPSAQGSLFADEAVERARRLALCKDAVRQRFGFMALVSGSSLVLAQQLEYDRDNYRLRTPCLTR
jgi:DNA polymerase IV